MFGSRSGIGVRPKGTVVPYPGQSDANDSEPLVSEEGLDNEEWPQTGPSAEDPAEELDEAPAPASSEPINLEDVVAKVLTVVHETIAMRDALKVSRGNLAVQIGELVAQVCRDHGFSLEDHERRKVTTTVVNRTLQEAKAQLKPAPAQKPMLKITKAHNVGRPRSLKRPRSVSSPFCWSGSTSARPSPYRRTNWPGKSARLLPKS